MPPDVSPLYEKAIRCNQRERWAGFIFYSGRLSLLLATAQDCNFETVASFHANFPRYVRSENPKHDSSRLLSQGYRKHIAFRSLRSESTAVVKCLLYALCAGRGPTPPHGPRHLLVYAVSTTRE